LSLDEHLDLVVIGGGLVGLAIARTFALTGRDVVVLEAEPMLGSHTSSRNSGVIHAGIYYEPGSAKAALCVAGKALLYAYCERRSVPHARLGKLVVATRDEELPALERIVERARANGVDDLAWLDAAEVRALEPCVRAVRALWSPSSGIVDASALLDALKHDALEHGASIVPRTPVLGGSVTGDGIELELGGAEPTVVRCRAVINAAGLRAPGVSRSIVGLATSVIPREHFAKGHYFALRGRSPFRHLVYPVPPSDGLGVHVTLDLAGRVRFGPDVSWVDGIDYGFDETRESDFLAAIRAYYPELGEGSLVPDYTGIRAKLGPAGSHHDFIIHGPTTSGAPGFAALYGIDSPGLTATLAIAEHVQKLAL
jgi:L-2-hydroxyglutarate oxidase LhgO